MKRINLDDKYEILFNDGTDGNKFVFKALRYGKEWRSLVGDNLILALVQRIEELEEKISS
jgi:hypothetical protein